ncbi:flagellar hook-associated protein FlgK [Microvirga subterranea]|uniref:Flagellar hook-associated protein 1 n=1 Tax=Microvirga subterranea TaxID=186651 RepID=A0A370H2L0_9HYPH|nr:flagellar hook-associated protein FlgK [Microvirga subterranea]RDI50413.1 flagellar hook-associated protein 1 FlgK [Microvirga subterranea]
MGLSLALNTARSSLQASSTQMSVISRNNAGATDATYSRKIASLVTADGGVRISVRRSSDTALFFKMLSTTSNAAAQQAVLEGYDKLKNTVGDTSLNQSAAAKIGALNSALAQYANKPDDANLGRAVVDRAGELATMLNEATKTVQSARKEADTKIAESVGRVNDLLGQFETANKAVIQGSAAGIDISDALDARDKILAQLSEEMGITVSTRENNDMAIYTDSGVTLFEKTPRSVTFNPTSAFAPGTVGSAVYVDGVQITGQGPMPIHAGRLVGLVAVRDDITVTYQGQLDAIAATLIDAFGEADPSATPPVGPKVAGLLTYSGSGAPAMPSGAGLVGLAGRITTNPGIDPSKGGAVEALRDGLTYTYNPGGIGGNAAFAERLNAIATGMNADRTFDPALGHGAPASLQAFSTFSAAWLESGRKTASAEVDYRVTLLGHASEALSNATGVNMDDETALMLQVEKSYSASAKLLSVIDEMLRTLLNAVN